jgi:hypothetical protein
MFAVGLAAQAAAGGARQDGQQSGGVVRGRRPNQIDARRGLPLHLCAIISHVEIHEASIQRHQHRSLVDMYVPEKGSQEPARPWRTIKGVSHLSIAVQVEEMMFDRRGERRSGGGRHSNNLGRFDRSIRSLDPTQTFCVSTPRQAAAREAIEGDTVYAQGKHSKGSSARRTPSSSSALHRTPARPMMSIFSLKFVGPAVTILLPQVAEHTKPRREHKKVHQTKQKNQSTGRGTGAFISSVGHLSSFGRGGGPGVQSPRSCRYLILIE